MATIADTNNLCEIEADNLAVRHPQEASWQPQPIDQSTDRQQSDECFRLRAPMNFIVIDKQSNLIKGTVTAPAEPTKNTKTLFIKAGELTLSKYFKLATKARAKGLLVDIGELAKVSHSFLDSLIRSDKKR